MGESSKRLPNGKRMRSTEQWIKEQGEDADIRETKIIGRGKDKGKVLTGLVNYKTGRRLLTGLRTATTADFLQEGVKKMARKLGALNS